MSRALVSGVLLAFSLGAADVARGQAAPVAGIVKHLQAPVPGALVFVYGVSDARLNRARTQSDGSFEVESVPAGVYDVIAYKTGYYPSLIRLWHQSSPAVSTIAIDLVPTQPVPVKGDDVWSWRDRLPADVLREITTESQAYRGAAPESVRFPRVVNGEFGSLASLSSATGGISRTQAALFGVLPGDLQYSFRGSYENVGDGEAATPLSRGSGTDAVLMIAASPETAASLTYAGREFLPPDGGTARLDREAVKLEHQTDSGAHVEWSVSRRNDNGFERATSVIPDRLPGASEDDEIRGRWSRDADDARGGVTLQVYRRNIGGGLRPDLGPTGDLLDAGLSAAAEKTIAGPVSAGARLDARAGSTGSALAPGAIVRVNLGGDASLVISGARRVSSGTPSALAAAAPRVVAGNEWEGAAAAEDASAAITIGNSKDGMIQVRASTTRIAEPLRIYFDGDLLLDVGSLYLFDGNRLEKLVGSASGHLSEIFDAAVSAETGRISGRLSSDAAEAFALASTDGRYYAGSASLTVRPTRTDVSCALRRIRQVLLGDTSRADNSSEMLRLSLGQDLTVLGFDPFGSAWKLVVSYETDSTPVADPAVEETALLRHRFMGGVSISF